MVLRPQINCEKISWFSDDTVAKTGVTPRTVQQQFDYDQFDSETRILVQQMTREFNGLALDNALSETSTPEVIERATNKVNTTATQNRPKRKTPSDAFIACLRVGIVRGPYYDEAAKLRRNRKVRSDELQSQADS